MTTQLTNPDSTTTKCPDFVFLHMLLQFEMHMILDLIASLIVIAGLCPRIGNRDHLILKFTFSWIEDQLVLI